MATLEKIRNRSGLLVSVIGFALLAFIVGDMLNGSQSFIRQSHDKVVEINGKKVTTEEFQKAVSELTEVYKMQTGQSSLSAEYMQQINAQVYENFVSQTLMNEEAAKIGMKVSSAELQDLVSGDNISPMIQQMPYFVNPETGAFDKALLMNFLQMVLMDDQYHQICNKHVLSGCLSRKISKINVCHRNSIPFLLRLLNLTL